MSDFSSDTPDSDLYHLRSEVAEKDASIRRLQTRLAAKEAQLEQQQALLHQQTEQALARDAQIAELQAQLAPFLSHASELSALGRRERFKKGAQQ
jgi:hypothetical protein